MPARVTLVFDEPTFIEEAVAAFDEAQIDCVAFLNPMKATIALEQAMTIELLITRTEFPAGMQNGVSLALITKTRRPHVKILFLGEPEHEVFTKDIRDGWLLLPITPSELVRVATTMLFEHAAA